MKALLLSIPLLISLSGSDITVNTPKPGLSIHYFYNSGWMIETDRHAIVIDFIPHTPSGSTPELLQDFLQQAVSGGKKILMMVTHDHKDHFDPAILQLSNAIPGIEYIFGWKYAPVPSVRMKTMNPGDSLIQPGYKIYTHASTDDGVGFLLNIDGYTIYHAGDHALWAEQLLQTFTDELKLIRSKADHIDLAFIPAARGMFTKCAYDSIIEKGIQLSIDILKPDAIALQHVGCEDKLSLYDRAYQKLKGKEKWIVPSRYNQVFKTQ